MFANSLVSALLLIGSIGLLVNGLPQPDYTRSSQIGQGNPSVAVLIPRNENYALSESHVEITLGVFIGNLQILSNQFKKCHHEVVQGVSVTVAVELVTTLKTNVAEVHKQYKSCSSCKPTLSQGSHPEVQKIVIEAYVRLSAIVSVYHEKYPEMWEDQFKPLFAALNIGQLSLELCADIHVDLRALLDTSGVDLDFLIGLGINVNLGGIIGIEPYEN